ncbi:MAG: hypothetical protein A3F89_06005 [Deltaproteobacteria bacterium RIFCSPLOWO2_12_FULL_50_11]|nr:MAG: hypothetical protein A2053_03285 [Deltaproteobacteria bacterium GWA2_50_8]OGQ66628.1 MAG: hypothetical protein A3F89_06005 [Deltaproteobacteria bacterium RIFCSPLOWO2_12_FULL_50_11]
MRTISQKKKNAELTRFLKNDLGISESVQVRGREVGLALWLIKRQPKKKVSDIKETAMKRRRKSKSFN